MPKVALYDKSGKQVGDIELNESVFGAEVNRSVLHDVVVNYLANQRQGTQNTKTRSEVRGGGIKPWRQKGTGRARQGSIRSPQWTGGGIALGPKPRSYRFELNKKVKRVALRSALSSKVLENDLIVLEGLSFDEIKTKQIAELLGNLGVNEKALFILDGNDPVVVKSARNIRGVETTFVGALNVYQILEHTKCIIVKDAVAKLEEVYA